MEVEKKITVFAHQAEAFKKLCAIAKTCFSMQRNELPISPRTNSLVIGPSGSGKTYLARAVAEATGAQFLTISISEWVLMGCTSRGAPNTWPRIGRFLLKHKNAKGIVIFLDELDKLSGNSTWEAFERTEIFKLLDLGVPNGLSDENDEEFSEEEYRTVREVLSTRTLIVGAGAFQDLWDEPQKRCAGFGSTSDASKGPSVNQLCKTLPRELVNRFRSEVLILPQLGIKDYEDMLFHATERMPPHLKVPFLELGLSRIQHALESRQGCRFVEELVLDAVMAEEAILKKSFHHLFK